jgi:L-2,4-diaminobutyrate decarboxylase
VTDFRNAYGAERFRAEGHRLIDALAEHLERATSGASPVLPWVEPEAKLAGWPADFPADPAPGADPTAFLTRVLAESHHLHHPRYVGHQVTAPLPLAALCELVAALLNNSMATYEMGPVSTAMERNLVRWLAARLGWPAGDGVLTSGGSAGNLTALLAARQARAGFDAWRLGNPGGPPLCVLASEQSHYSVARALAIMGLGAGGVQPVPVDARWRLRPDALEAAHAAATAAGKRVIAVVASAGSTATGAVDPLDAIADFCAAHDLWLHVDGAHGASAALSSTHRGLLAGIERADSVVWDMHKMMMMPSLVTAVLFRDPSRSYSAFAQEASYLFDGKHPEEEWMNGAVRTLECTKRMMSLKVYAALQLCGTRFFGDYIDHTFALARRFGAMIAATSDFTLAIEPTLNIVCFRYGEDDALQARIRRRIVESGRFFLVQTALGGRTWLRTSLMNPLTTDADLSALLDAVRAAAG